MCFHFLSPIFPNVGCVGAGVLTILLLWHRGADATYLQRPGQGPRSLSPAVSHESAGAQLARTRVAFPV